MTAIHDPGTTRREGSVAERLLESSDQLSYDPRVEVDWDAPLDPSYHGASPEWSTLYGTPYWNELSESQRAELTRQESASVACTGIWFELVLQQMMLRDMYTADRKSPEFQWALTEIADECRHSIMFARGVEKLNAPAYLPTRRVIEHRANSLLRGETRARFALAFLDIDNFKHINDYYGHPIGDALLVEVAKRLTMDLRESDMLSRISGDEFLLLLNPVQNQQEVADFIGFILQRLRAPFFIEGSEIFASTSIGVSLYPEHGRSYEELRQNADIAMYRVKNDGKGAAVFFDAGMEREALARMKVEQSLRQAILEKRFCCAFQPKVDIRTQQIKGIEALVRLRDDEGVIQAPGTFINLAVELGLIDELTHLVLGEIVKSIDLINDTFGPHTSISINVAAKQAGNPEFMRPFAQALAATGYPQRFMIEVTEDAFVAKTHFQDEILPIFRRLGVGISIDDFGIGYSSLSALADITADEIKIDRSFITDIHKRPRSQGILRAIESLSEALGMTVIAEGIESFEELAYLQAATKIRYAQGYYFSRPIFLEELTPVVPMASEARASLASRPPQESRSAYVRRGSHRR